jgi:hypothetical protein
MSNRNLTDFDELSFKNNTLRMDEENKRDTPKFDLYKKQAKLVLNNAKLGINNIGHP